VRRVSNTSLVIAPDTCAEERQKEERVLFKDPVLNTYRQLAVRFSGNVLLEQLQANVLKAMPGHYSTVQDTCSDANGVAACRLGWSGLINIFRTYAFPEGKVGSRTTGSS